MSSAQAGLAEAHVQSIFLIHLGFRNLTASVRNVRQAVDRAASSAPHPPKRESISPASDNPAARTAVVLQEQAKKSDDAHKARIQAHASRQVPPISNDGRETIKHGLKARLAIKHRFPPRVPQRSMSYLGGLPIVPEDFDWPTLHNRKGLLERPNSWRKSTARIILKRSGCGRCSVSFRRSVRRCSMRSSQRSTRD